MSLPGAFSVRLQNSKLEHITFNINISTFVTWCFYLVLLPGPLDSIYLVISTNLRTFKGCKHSHPRYQVVKQKQKIKIKAPLEWGCLPIPLKSTHGIVPPTPLPAESRKARQISFCNCVKNFCPKLELCG